MEQVRILSPTAILGYGFPVESFYRGLERDPHVLAVDAGSIDPGPYYLGAGISFTQARAVKRDLSYMIREGIKRNIPVLVGTAGGSGANSHLQWCEKIVEEIAREENLSFKMALISAEMDKEEILQQYRAGRIQDKEELPLSKQSIEDATAIVAQMGPEPFIEALQAQAQVILAGRAYDPAVFAAYPIWKGMDAGLALHMGKILECAAIAADPGSGRDAMLGTIYQDCFQVEPLNPDRRCTTFSVAAHTLYEKADPVHLPGPGGILNLEESSFREIGQGVVQVQGSRFTKTTPYYLMLEGAKKVGYRTISIAGLRDPVMIKSLDTILQEVQRQVQDNFPDMLCDQNYHLIFRTYGRDGVMGALESEKSIPHEIGLILEVVAPTQEEADTLCSFARSTLLHYGYPDRISTAGNLAFPYSPSDFSGGPVYNFCLYHLMEAETMEELFPIQIKQVTPGGNSYA